MSQSNAEILRKGYDDFATGDVEAVLAVFAEDIAWHVPGKNPLSGDYTGHDEVVGFFGQLGERSGGTFHLEVHDILDNGENTVVVLVGEKGERNGNRLDVEAVHVWRVEDGIAKEFRAFQHDDYENDEFWA